MCVSTVRYVLWLARQVLFIKAYSDCVTKLSDIEHMNGDNFIISYILLSLKIKSQPSLTKQTGVWYHMISS